MKPATRILEDELSEISSDAFKQVAYASPKHPRR